MCREARARKCKILCWVKTGSFHMGIFFHNHKHPESITGPFNSEIVGGRCSSPVEPLLSTRRSLGSISTMAKMNEAVPSWNNLLTEECVCESRHISPMLNILSTPVILLLIFNDNCIVKHSNIYLSWIVSHFGLKHTFVSMVSIDFQSFLVGFFLPSNWHFSNMASRDWFSIESY